MTPEQELLKVRFELIAAEAKLAAAAVGKTWPGDLRQRVNKIQQELEAINRQHENLL